MIKVVQASHRQGDIRYDTSRDKECSCMPLMSVSWIFFKSPGLWDKFELGCILARGDQLFKSVCKFRYRGVLDLPEKFLLENYSMNVEFLENKKEKLQQHQICFLLQKL